MKAANIDTILTGTMRLDIWKKFVLLSHIRHDKEHAQAPRLNSRGRRHARSLFKLMHETIAVGRAAGVDLSEDFAVDLDRSIAAFPPTAASRKCRRVAAVESI